MNFFSTSPIEILPTTLHNGRLAKIKYNGFLSGENNDVWAHVGFGDKENWEGVRDIKMIKTSQGYEAIIPMREASYFHIAFTSDFESWDNNNGYDYSFPIQQEIK